ncbi:anti-sigma B factor RsbW [Tuberibacillus sp. Marseille-P3662]|uniref:anti-sigma B factor RsbW n=1 Tax=Tuberibacillus sp. Marseille-P3662 TaxID=1965358 RepID=UPI000A1CB2BB|nr:anti-sigma B factor RsbW [Tuberibacillus sp. Marseille-P3662]
MSQQVDSVELKIPAKSEYVGVVRLTASGVAYRMGYSYDEIEDIKVAVSEACTNAVNHAYHGVDSGQIAIHIRSYTDRMEVGVIDEGCSFDYEDKIKELKPIDAGVSIEHVNEGGLGLFLIDTLMDQVNISGGSGINVIMTKFLDEDGVLNHVNKVQSIE